MSGVIVLPWSMLHGDNHRMIPAKRGKAVRLITAPEYREGKEALETLLIATYRGEKFHTPVELYARCYFPDKRKRDAGNYRKFIGDAMSGICFTDDTLVWKETWERVGIDTANPRIEITVTPLEKINAA